MSGSYVIFATQAAFDTAHNAAKTQLELPEVGINLGTQALAPGKQQTVAVQRSTAHPTDDTVVVHIEDFWPSDLRTDFVFKTVGQVGDYFPDSDI